MRSCSKCYIDCLVTYKGAIWRFIGVYETPYSYHYRHTWDLLWRLLSIGNWPWCVMGDFNYVLFVVEKLGDRLRVIALC